MATKQSKTSLASALILTVLAAVVAVIAYKQIFLVGRLTGNIPEPALTQSLQTCLKQNMTPDMLKKELTALQQSGGSNFMNLGGLLGSVFDQLSTAVVETRITKNYLNETKVLTIQDLFGENADIRVSGSLDIVSKVPVMGDMAARKDYQTVLIKRGSAYHFDGLDVKKPESNQWDHWACTQTL